MSIEENKLIAEFMEYQHSAYPEIDKWEMDNLKYHSSWDWLMIACWKFRDLNNHGNVPEGWSYKCEKIESAILGWSTPEMAAKELAEAIKWYNSL